MGIGTLVKAANNGQIKAVLKQRFRREREIAPPNTESWVRVSSFADMCPREEVLCGRGGLVRRDIVEADLNTIFAHGSALHWVLQNVVLPEAGMIVGKWLCLGCATIYGGCQTEGVFLPEQQVARPKKCTKCEGEEFLYREQRFGNQDYRISGHPDGFLVVPGLSGLGIVEAKSIGSSWEIRHAPMMSHVIQAQIYMWLTGLKWAKILYWEKGGRGMGAFFEHHLPYDPETIQNIKETIRSIHEGMAGGALPARICTTNDCPRAKNCIAVRPCFDPQVG